MGHDLSAGAASALRLAAAWAAWREIPLHVVHALARPLAAAPCAELEAKVAEGAATACVGARGAPPVVALVEGDAARVLEDAARARSGWLAVGCEGTSATLLRQAGSVATELARAAETPLLVAPPRWRGADPARGGRPVSRVLVGLRLDGRDAALVAASVDLAREFEADLALAHVVDVSFARDYPPAAREAVSDMEKARAATEALDAEAAELPIDLATQRQVTTHVVRQGPLDRDLAGLATSQGIDCLVVGRGRTAARLVAVTPCALLVV